MLLFRSLLNPLFKGEKTFPPLLNWGLLTTVIQRISMGSDWLRITAMGMRPKSQGWVQTPWGEVWLLEMIAATAPHQKGSTASSLTSSSSVFPRQSIWLWSRSLLTPDVSLLKQLAAVIKKVAAFQISGESFPAVWQGTRPGQRKTDRSQLLFLPVKLELMLSNKWINK